MEVTLDKTYGPALVNLLRQACMTAVPTIRPIAVSVGADSNVLDSSDSAVEDMTTFIHNVMQPTYYAGNDLEQDKPIVFSMSAMTAVSTQDFSAVGVVCKEDNVVIHLLSETAIKVIFRYSCGKYSAKDNLAFLQDANIDTNKYVVVPSRHSAVDAFTINEHASENYYKADLAIKSATLPESTIIKYGLDAIQNGVAELRKNLLDN